MTDIDDLLDQRMTGSSGDYPPWFNEEDTGQGEPPIQDGEGTLQGVVTEVRDDPFYDPSEEENPKPILHVREDSGNEWSTRTHSVLVDLIRKQDPHVGDYVRIQADGNFKTDNGQVANDYQLGVIRADELEELDMSTATTDGGATTESPSEKTPVEPETPEEPEPEVSEIEESEPEETEDSGFDFNPDAFTVSEISNLVETADDVSKLEDMLGAEKAGPDRKTAKGAIEERISELSGGEDEEPEEAEESDTDVEIPGDVIEFTNSLLSFHGELTVDELNDYLNDTRDFDIDPEVVISALEGVEFDGETVTKE